MKKDDIFDSINDIDDTYLSDYEQSLKSKKGKVLWMRWGILAACFCVVTAVVLTLVIPKLTKAKTDSEDSYPSTTAAFYSGIVDSSSDNNDNNSTISRTVNQTTSDVTKNNGEIALIPKWEDRTNTEKYDTLDYNSNSFIASTDSNEKNTMIINKSDVDKKISVVTMNGYDIYEKKDYTTSVTVFSIKNLSDNIFVAVKFKNDDKYYLFVNFEYSVPTLKELYKDINISRATFGKTELSDSNNINYTLDNISDEIVLKYVFSKNYIETAKSIEYSNDLANSDTFLSIDFDISSGLHSTVQIYSNGFTAVYTCGTSFYFMISADDAKSIYNYVKSNGTVSNTTAPVAYNYTTVQE